jgi:uncharacterized membrane protein (UPF0127 family)
MGEDHLGWLVRDGQVLASLEVAGSRQARMRGLLGRERFDGALLLRPARSVHTFRMRFPIDVAFLTDDLVVLRAMTMVPWRATLPVLRARAVLEAEAGAFRSWGLTVGDHLEIKE